MLAIWILAAQTATGDVKATAEDYVQKNQAKIVRELSEALSIPDVASDRANIRKKAELLVGILERCRFTASLLETEGNQHGENKNLRTGHLFRAVVILAATLGM